MVGGGFEVRWGFGGYSVGFQWEGGGFGLDGVFEKEKLDDQGSFLNFFNQNNINFDVPPAIIQFFIII